MGGLCSKSGKGDKRVAKREQHYGDENHKDGSDLVSVKEEEGAVVAAGVGGTDDFYDGIPRYADSFSHKSRSGRSRQAAVAKVGWLVVIGFIVLLFVCFIAFCLCVQFVNLAMFGLSCLSLFTSEVSTCFQFVPTSFL